MCFIGIYQQFCFDQCFLDFGKDFQEDLIHLSRHSSVCKSLSTLFYHMLWKRKKLCYTGIQLLFCSDQCFLDFGEDVREYLIARIKTQFCC